MAGSLADIRVSERKFLQNSIFILTFAALIISAQQSWAVQEPAGRAGILAGKVTVERSGRQETLRAGEPVFVEDKIVTGAGGSAEIVLVDKSRIKLASDTSLEISEYLYSPDKKIRYGLISLTCGKAGFAVQDFQQFNDRRFRVRTPTAVVGSRDTDFIVAYDRQRPRDEVCRGGMTAALCLEDSIVFYSRGFPTKPVLLTGKMISRVCGPNLPTPPRFVTAAELTRIMCGLDRVGNTKDRAARGVH